MANVKEFAMATVVRRIADSNDTATKMTAKLFAECGVTTTTPDTAENYAWDVCKTFSAWFDAREKAGVDNETDDNKAILNAYAAQARGAAREWFKLFAVKPGKKEGDEPRPFVGMDNVETGIIGDIIGYSRKEAGGVDNDAKLARIFTKYLILETERLLDGKPYVRLSEAQRKEADKAANAKKREKSNQTRKTNQDKVDEANDKADKAEQDLAAAEKKLSDAETLIKEAIELVKSSSATELEKAAIIGKLNAAISK